MCFQLLQLVFECKVGSHQYWCSSFQLVDDGLGSSSFPVVAASIVGCHVGHDAWMCCDLLGVKTVEYSHKWDLGLLPGKLYQSQVENPPHHDIPTALPYLQAPAVVCLVGFAIWWIVWAAAKEKPFQMEVSGPLAIAAACFIGGAVLGLKLEESPAPRSPSNSFGS